MFGSGFVARGREMVNDGTCNRGSLTICMISTPKEFPFLNSVARWQNLIPSWILPGWREWGRNPRQGRDQILHCSGAIVQNPEGPNTYNLKNLAIAIWQPCFKKALRAKEAMAGVIEPSEAARGKVT